MKNGKKRLKKQDEFQKLVSIMKKLRGRGGCPWDKKQTGKTLLPYLLEEAYELIEAVNRGDEKALREELGDMLLQVVFHSQIASEKKKFTVYDVIKGLNEKLIQRHPHVFGGKGGIKTAAHVRDFWEKEKKKVKKRKSLLDGVPAALPALLRAGRLQSRAGSAGFEWKAKKGILKKIEEELKEVKEAVAEGDKKKVEEEIGDILFVLVALSRFYKINPENTLQRANKKFIRRFEKIEKKLNKKMSEKEILRLWKGTKQGIKS